jgi:2-hydroxychromene-2-carboxylate isomerase
VIRGEIQTFDAILSRREFPAPPSLQVFVGDLISLDDRRAARGARGARASRGASRGAQQARSAEAVRFCFDLASPWTYLAAERVERLFGGLHWHPVASDVPVDASQRAAVEARARELRMPLVWPERGGSGRAARRVAALAVEQGCAAAFVVAAGRLAFCGGYDLDDPEILAEAAAVAGLGLQESLTAAGDSARDVTLERDAALLAARSTEGLPALSIAGRLFCGEGRIPEAVAAFADLRGANSSRLVPTRGSR